MTTKIYTDIHNKQNADRVVGWTGKGPLWLGGQSSVRLPYNVWESTPKLAYKTIVAEIESGITEIEVFTLKADGSKDIIYTGQPIDPVNAFDQLIAAKEWDAALLVFKELYGEDKITFTTRTLMRMKDFDAIAKKYKLNTEKAD